MSRPATVTDEGLPAEPGTAPGAAGAPAGSAESAVGRLPGSPIFPAEQPPGYRYLASEPAFDPDADLALHRSEQVVTLADLGYDEAFRSRYGSGLALTEPFQVLSAGGLAKLRGVIEQLEPELWREAETARKPAAVAPMLRGNAYRSRFIRDLILSPRLLDFVSDLGGMVLRPSAYTHEVAHLNFAPDGPDVPTVAWHHDTNAFVLVLMVHDPAEVDGGDFQYFRGTRFEGRAILDRGEQIDPGRCVTPSFPAGGYGVLMQGSAVLHRATPMNAPARRISMATSLDPVDARYPDPNRFYFVERDFAEANRNAELEHNCRYVEHARHAARRGEDNLRRFSSEAAWSADRHLLADQLAEAVVDVSAAIEALRAGDIPRAEARRRKAERDS